MFRGLFRAAVVMLALVVSLPWAASAAPLPAPRAAAAHGSSVATGLWSFLTHLWNEAGCWIDPYGRCIDQGGSSAGATATTDEGCLIDPYGRCIDHSGANLSTTTDEGCYIDPYGRCGS